MIIIKMHKNKWRIEVDKEEWEFTSKEQMETAIDDLIMWKDLCGRIIDNGKH